MENQSTYHTPSNIHIIDRTLSLGMIILVEIEIFCLIFLSPFMSSYLEFDIVYLHIIIYVFLFKPTSLKLHMILHFFGRTGWG